MSTTAVASEDLGWAGQESTDIVECFVGELPRFMAEKWGRRPAVFRATGQQKGFVEDLLTLADADAILESPSTRPPYVEVTRGGLAVREKLWIHPVGSKSLVIPDAVNVTALAAEFSRGATIILNHLDDYEIKNRTVCDAFQEVFGATTKTVAFITPPQQQGLGAHYDTFEGFIVQTHGQKTWRVFEQVQPRPITPLGFRDAEIPGSEPILEVTLSAGDTLYVPWGSPHFATSESTVSCHVTIMTFPLSWDQVVRAAAMESIPADAYDEIALFGCQPTEAVTKKLTEYLLGAAAQLSAANPEGLLRKALAQSTPPIEPQAQFLARQAARTQLSPDTVVRSRADVPVRITALDDGRLHVTAGGSTFRMPGSARPLLDQLLTGQPHRLAELRTYAPDQAVRAVVDQLLACGALTTDAADGDRR